MILQTRLLSRGVMAMLSTDLPSPKARSLPTKLIGLQYLMIVTEFKCQLVTYDGEEPEEEASVLIVSAARDPQP